MLNISLVRHWKRKNYLYNWWLGYRIESLLKSRPEVWLNSFATSLAFYLSIVPLGWCLTLKTHLVFNRFIDGWKRIKCQVFFFFFFALEQCIHHMQELEERIMVLQKSEWHCCRLLILIYHFWLFVCIGWLLWIVGKIGSCWGEKWVGIVGNKLVRNKQCW